MTAGIPNDLKAISTAYGGCNFRSRLEARWAIYFDAIGWRWNYEPEGFELPSGVKYLPDFWFPAFNLYAEIKHEGAPTSAFNKARGFGGCGFPILLLEGLPERRAYPLCAPTRNPGDLTVSVSLMPARMKYAPLFYGPTFALGEFSHYDQPTLAACALAKSARFEFGDTPVQARIFGTQSGC